MKVWNGYGTEHSANLVIIGKFKTLKEASKIKTIIESLSQLILDEDDGSGKIIDALANYSNVSKKIKDYLLENNIPVGQYELQGLAYSFDISQEDKNLIITTDEPDINVFMSLMAIHGEAKIEIYSAHSYKSGYGRQT